MNGKVVAPVQADVEAPHVFKVSVSFVLNDKQRSMVYVFAAADVDDAKNKALRKAGEAGYLWPRVTAAARY